MLTPQALRDPGRPSGYRHVNGVECGHGPTWRAQGGTRAHFPGEQTDGWYGPGRKFPVQAAQDYCNHINSGTKPPPAPVLKTLDKSKRPNGSKRTITEAERRLRAALREAIAQNPPERMHDPVCYLIGIKNDIYAVKVGYADYNVYSRLDSLQTGNPRQLVLLGTLPGGIETEKRLHAKYAEANILQEWFRPRAALLSEFGLTVREYSRKVH